jgi:DnaJ-class molecular chaperone
VSLLKDICPRCEGDGYQHLFGRFYLYPCRSCKGTGERPRIAYRIFRALRHGAPIGEDY